MSEVIRFKDLSHPRIFTGLTGVVKFDEHKIYGVSLITSDIEATGHGLFVDDICLHQLHEFGKEMGQIPVTQNHEGGVEDVNGWVENVRLDGKQLRGDWCLLASHPDTVTMLERAHRQPKTFGLSLAFKGNPEGVLHMGRKCARAEALLSADVVKRPAANPMGLFSARDNANVDRAQKDARDKFSRKTIELQNTMPAEPTLADVLNELQSMKADIAKHGEVQQQLIGHINQGVTGAPEAGEVDPEFLSALNDATDEELAAYNQKNGTDISRADVNAAVSEYNAGLQANQGEEQGEEGEEGDGQFRGSYGDEAQGQAQGVAAGGGAETGAAGTAFNALQRELIELKRKFNAKEAKEIQFAEKQATDDVRAKIAAIVGQRDQLVQLSEKLVAENEALRLHVRTGTRPVIAGIDTGIRLFSRNEQGQLHPWQERVRQIELSEKVSTAKAMTMADKEDNGAAHEHFIASQSPRNRR